MLAAFAPAKRTQADQRRDYMMDVQPYGQRVMLDYFGIGAQLTFEHRQGIFQKANSYTLSTTALLSYPYGELSAAAAVRVLFFEFQLSAGYRTVWRNLSFEPGENGSYCRDCDRPARRERDKLFGSDPDTDRYPVAEARLQMYMPFNDHFVATWIFSANYQGLKPRSFDWLLADIHDPGTIFRSEFVAFIKDRRWGGIGPYLQLQSLPRAGHYESEFSFGFNAATRPGLVARNDMLFLTFLVKPNDPYYGLHSYYAPVRALVLYRLQLWL